MPGLAGLNPRASDSNRKDPGPFGPRIWNLSPVCLLIHPELGCANITHLPGQETDLESGRQPLNLENKFGLRPFHRLRQAPRVLLVGSGFMGVACLAALSAPTEQSVASAIALAVNHRALAAPRTLPAGFSALLSGTPQTFSAKDEKPATLDETLSQAETAFKEGRLEQAIEKCRQAIELDPKSAHAYYFLGVIELERGAQEEAKQALLQSLKLDPSHIATRVDLGKLYLLSQEWRAATREFQAAIKLGDATGSGRFGLALALLGETRYTEALPQLVAAVEADPKDVERLFTLIATELQLKQAGNARKNLAQIEKLSPLDPWVFYRLGKLLADHGMASEAEAKFERATALLAESKDSPHPSGLKLSDVYLRVARLHYDHHDYQGALQYLDKIEPGSLEPKLQAEALHLEGASYFVFGEVDKAREKLKQAAETNPAAPDYFVHWAWAELLSGDSKAATTAAAIGRSKWPQHPQVQQLAGILERESMPERAGIPFSADWHLKGEGLVCCPCTVPCPCRSNAPPTHGHCENTGAYRITAGRYGNISLDGFTFAAVDASMGEENIPSTLYVNPSATDEQLIALERIFQSFNPLRPFLFLNVKRAEISLVDSQEEKTYEVQIPGVLQIKIRRQLDSQGEALLRTAALDYFSNTIEYAQNLTYKVWNPDGSIRWNFSGRQANFRTVDLDSRDYRDQTMLIQYSDGSGFFNPRQLELIKNLKLPTLRSYPKPAK